MVWDINMTKQPEKIPEDRTEIMKLGRKNLLYSMTLAGILLLLLVGYFIYMLPSLYVDYVMEQNLKSVREQHKAYRESGSYEGIKVRNAAACFSIEIPMEGNSVLVTGKSFSVEIVVRDRRLTEVLDRCRKEFRITDRGEQAIEGVSEEELEVWEEIFREAVGENSSLPVEIRLLYSRDMGKEFRNESIKVHSYSDHLIIVEFSVEDSANHYANYIAMEQTDTRLIFTCLPVVAPEADEIRPVVLQSLPMLAAVILLLVLLFSQMYSRGIVQPITELALHAGQMKPEEAVAVRRLSENWPDRRDEVRELADTLDDFYLRIRESYRKLEGKNRELEEENKRQEIFLRASSHQLKTPIAAALLLVEGMINQVGRYKETEVYLPRVKEQLLSMRKMVEDILYLNHCADHIRLQQVEAGRLLQERLGLLQVPLADRRITVEDTEMEQLTVLTDELMLTQILDNLLSNAAAYTPVGSRIEIAAGRLGMRTKGRRPERETEAEAGRTEIETGRRGIQIRNFGVTIPEELLPHIFEPFVSGNHGRTATAGSHGLGLYIASYYAKKLGISLSVTNQEDSVVTEILFDETGLRARMEESSTGSSSEIHMDVLK